MLVKPWPIPVALIIESSRFVPSTTRGPTIATPFEGVQELLSLFNGSLELEKLSVEKLEQNQYGVVKFQGKPGFVSYRIEYDGRLSIDNPPVPDDLTIPILVFVNLCNNYAVILA